MLDLNNFHLNFGDRGYRALTPDIRGKTHRAILEESAKEEGRPTLDEKDLGGHSTRWLSQTPRQFFDTLDRTVSRVLGYKDARLFGDEVSTFGARDPEVRIKLGKVFRALLRADYSWNDLAS